MGAGNGASGDPTEMPEDDGPLLTPQFMAKLKQLTLVSRKVFLGRFKGERRSQRRGTSVEFADFRNYVAGDDPRHIDWNTYGRLEKLFLKLFIEEEDLAIHLLIDTSKSMAWYNKFHYARRLTAALSAISLMNQDRVMVGGFSGGLQEFLRPMRGRASMGRMLNFLNNLEADGGTDLMAALKRWILVNRQPGVIVIISDFLDPAGYEAPLKLLQGRGFDAFALQVLTKQELNPEIRGDLRLIDSESGAPVEVSINEAILKHYRAAVQSYCDGLKDFCARRGLGYLLASTEEPVEDMVVKYLRQAGLVK